MRLPGHLRIRGPVLALILGAGAGVAGNEREADGAHWAYRPLTEPSIPSARISRAARGPIDAFVLRKLREMRLGLSPEADRRTLLRRLSFDLVGMPPTEDELREFLGDRRPDAYDRVVDRLLASPHHGERWARHWMDAVHYAETHGHDQDRPREHAWPYRDYLIEAFNGDRPYARFVREQVAGDVLFPDDPAALVATGLLATGPWDESSLRDIREDSLDREIARYVDRDDIITTVMSTFTSSTVHCARCHDHKFDPISQREYYGLQAVFAATDKANRRYDSDPALARRRRELTRELAALPRRVETEDRSLLSAELADEVERWEAGVRALARRWQAVELVEFLSEEGSRLERLEDGSLLSTGPRPERDTYTLVVRARQAVVTGLRVEVLTHPSLPHSGPGRQDNGNLHLNEVVVWRLDADEGPPGAKGSSISIKSAAADFNQGGWAVDRAIDGDPATAWGIYPEVGKPHRALFEFAEPIEPNGPDDTVTLRVELRQLHGGGHLIGRPRLATTAADDPLTLSKRVLDPAIAKILRVSPEKRHESQRIALGAHVLRRCLESELAGLPKQALVYCGTNRFDADGSFRPSTAPRPVHVLDRGDVRRRLEPALPAALGLVSGLGGRLAVDDLSDEGARRAALAGWLASSENSLTWRSIANRVWLHHFGRGIVDTPNDFGGMGSQPTHPALLDWLAADFRDTGGSLKRLHRQIVTSAAYRQSSDHEPRQAAVDADNRWLWRMSRRRLDAESIRDALLRISSTLDATMGGPSVRQFNQSKGAHVTPRVDYTGFDVRDAANFRRSVYRFIFRTVPDPFMETLDCPDASQLTPKRSTSFTALQALALLNDKFVVYQSELIARRVIENLRAKGLETPRLEDQVDAAYRLVFSRQPRASERAAVLDYAREHGLANACRFLVNTNEFIFVD